MGRKNTNARKRKEHVNVIELMAPPPEQIAKGYTAGFVMDDDGKQARAYRNCAHDPVERWLKAGRIEGSQKAAIDVVRRLWGILGVTPKVTASYGERIGGSSGGEHMTAIYLDAKDDLHRIQGYFAGLHSYWDCFENVCRWNEPAGVAGSDLGYATSSAQLRALTIVQFVADIIATKERL